MEFYIYRPPGFRVHRSPVPGPDFVPIQGLLRENRHFPYPQYIIPYFNILEVLYHSLKKITKQIDNQATHKLKDSALQLQDSALQLFHLFELFLYGKYNDFIKCIE